MLIFLKSGELKYLAWESRSSTSCSLLKALKNSVSLFNTQDDGKGNNEGEEKRFDPSGYDKDLVESLERDILQKNPNVHWWVINCRCDSQIYNYSDLWWVALQCFVRNRLYLNLVLETFGFDTEHDFNHWYDFLVQLNLWQESAKLLSSQILWPSSCLLLDLLKISYMCTQCSKVQKLHVL